MRMNVNSDELFAALKLKGFDDPQFNPQYYSIVHEIGDANEDCATPYEHTHAALMWTKERSVKRFKKRYLIKYLKRSLLRSL